MSLKVIWGFLFLALLSLSCEKDDPVIPNEEELITTLTFSLTPLSGGQSVVLSFKDLDGDGGDVPIILGGTLKNNTTYSGKIILLNETVSPADIISDEVEEEGAEHQFFYELSGTLDAVVNYEDQDENGLPIGLKTILTTGNASNGTLKIILRHEPDKNASGVSDGSVLNAGGETDIEVTFNVKIE